MSEEDRIVERLHSAWTGGPPRDFLRAAIRETARVCENAVEFQGSEKAHPLRVVVTFKSRIPNLFPEAFQEKP